jgi:aspartyl-tRNA(Asn)/glutamyl-tRNA(Gln) amidotransferase subunit B
VKRVAAGQISGKIAKDVFQKMFSTGEAPAVIIEREGLQQISDTGALDAIIAEVIAANPKQLEQYRAGKTTVLNFFLGQVMKASRGQANPTVVTDLLKRALNPEEKC